MAIPVKRKYTTILSTSSMSTYGTNKKLLKRIRNYLNLITRAAAMQPTKPLKL